MEILDTTFLRVFLPHLPISQERHKLKNLNFEQKKMDEVGSSIFKTISTLGQMKIKLDSINFRWGKKRLNRFDTSKIHDYFNPPKKICFLSYNLVVGRQYLYYSYKFSYNHEVLVVALS